MDLCTRKRGKVLIQINYDAGIGQPGTYRPPIDANVLALFGRAAWAHDNDSSLALTPTFYA
jgi:hypothetical protein